MRSEATFKSDAFNTTESKGYFINPGCFGDDLAAWLASRLRERGATAGEPGQEDFGWYLYFTVAGIEHCLLVIWHPDGYWTVVVERSRGCLLSLIGRRSVGISREAVRAVHAVLSTSSEIRNLRWEGPATPGGGQGGGTPRFLALGTRLQGLGIMLESAFRF